MIRVAVVSFLAAFALGSGAMFFLSASIITRAETLVDQTTSNKIISPLADAEVLGETNQTEPSPISTPSPVSDPSLTPTLKQKSSPKPTPPPIPSPTAATGAQLDEWFTTYANRESINRELLRNIALCESKFNQFAKNGDYLGLYQFSSSTWVTTRRSMNQNPDPKLRTQAEEAIKTAAFRLATAGPAAWPNCAK